MKTLTNLWARASGKARILVPILIVALLAFLLPHTPEGLATFGVAFAGMIIDTSLQMCNQTALSTAGTGLALVGNVIDLTVARDIAAGRPMYLVITVTSAVTSAGAATVQFILATDTIAAIHVDGTAAQIYNGSVIPKATLVPNYQIIAPLPLELPNYAEFLGILQNVGTAALTAGAITAEIVFDVPLPKTYPQSARITL